MALPGLASTPTTASRRSSRWLRVADGVGLVLLALVVWGGAMEGASEARGAALFAISLGALLVGLRPWYGAALVVASVMALGESARWVGGGVSPWIWAFAALATLGSWHLLRRIPRLAWPVASLPIWAVAGSYPDESPVSKALAIVAIVTFMVAPAQALWRLVSSKPTPGASVIPNDALRRGPLVSVMPRAFVFTKGVWIVRALTWLSGAVSLVGIVMAIAGSEVGLMLIAIGASLGLGFGLSLFLTVRQRYRVDAIGIHRRVAFGETTIPWQEVTEVFSRRVMVRWVTYTYLVVSSAKAEVAFPTTLPGAEELASIIEQATGLRWG